MLLETILIASGSAFVLGIGGFLVGRRIGNTTRDDLTRSLRISQEDLRRSRLELSGVLKAEKSERVQTRDLPKPQETGTEVEIAQHLAEVEQRSAEQTAAILAQIKDLRAEMQTSSEPQDMLTAQVREVVGPIAERARMQTALTNIPDTFSHRGHLEGLLAAIAERAGLSAVILSDEAGLLLAEAGADATDALAATASLLLTLADRLSNSGQPAAVSAVVQDAEARLIVHRIFFAGSERYVLTGVSKRTTVVPDILDPTLARLRRLLLQPGQHLEAVA